MANCCCTSIYNAGCINHCTGLTINGLVGETITVTIEQGSRLWTQTLAIVAGSVTITALNDEGQHLIKLGQTVEIDGIEYDCITVKTSVNIEGGAQGSGGGGFVDTNFANTDLILTGDRVHQLGGIV